MSKPVVHYWLPSVEETCIVLTIWVVEPESIHHVLQGASTEKDS
jgi:hypothetical protein